MYQKLPLYAHTAQWSEQDIAMVADGKDLVHSLRDEIDRLRAGISSIFHESSEDHVQFLAKRLLDN